MITRGPRPQTHFLLISNTMARDYRLSPKALGLLVNILSRPDNWRVTVTGLAKEWGVGYDAIMGGMKELTGAGYAYFVRTQDKQGRFHNDWVVTDNPSTSSDGASLRDSGRSDEADDSGDEDYAHVEAAELERAGNIPDVERGAGVKPGRGKTASGESAPGEIASGKARSYRSNVGRSNVVQVAKHSFARQQDQAVQDLADGQASMGAPAPPAVEGIPAGERKPKRSSRAETPPLTTGAGLARYFARQAEATFGGSMLEATNHAALAGKFNTWHRGGAEHWEIKSMIDHWLSLASGRKLAAPAWQAFLADRQAMFAWVRQSAVAPDPTQHWTPTPLSEQVPNWPGFPVAQ